MNGAITLKLLKCVVYKPMALIMPKMGIIDKKEIEYALDLMTSGL